MLTILRDGQYQTSQKSEAFSQRRYVSIVNIESNKLHVL